jgi:DNA-binding IscR family transcriptional regulator
MKLNKKLEVGIKAVSALKRLSGGSANIAELAEEIDTTPNFLAQIMRNLRDENIVVVKRGPGGGYTVNQDLKITAYHVAKAVGRDMGVLSLDQAPLNRLNKALIEAFLNTAI